MYMWGGTSSHALAVQLILLKRRGGGGRLGVLVGGQFRAPTWKSAESGGRKLKQRKREKLGVKNKQVLVVFQILD